MLLGLSSTDGDSIDPVALTEGAGVECGLALVELVTALNSGDRAVIEDVFARLDTAVGIPARIDAVGVYANFSMMTRVADGTGTPLDAGTTTMSTNLRAELGVNDLGSARL